LIFERGSDNAFVLRSAAMTEKLQLGENHRRVVSVLMRGIDQMCSEVDAALEESSGILQRVLDDVSRAQKKELRNMVASVRTEVGRIASQIELDTGALSMRRKVAALISASIVNVEESDPQKLRGYGPLSDVAMKRLQDEFGRLHTMLEKMAAVLEEF
jgi:hypothetical protein